MRRLCEFRHSKNLKFSIRLYAHSILFYGMLVTQRLTDASAGVFLRVMINPPLHQT